MAEHKTVTKVTGQDDGASAVFESVGKAANQFGQAMHALGGAFAFDKIKSTFTDILHATDESTNAENRFAGAMRASGKAADPDAFIELADALEQTTVFSKEATLNAGAMFGKFGIGQAEVTKIMPGLQDFAAFMGRDLPGSADAMGRAIAMGSNGLRGLGLAFTESERKAFDMASEHERVGIIMQKVQGFAGGFASEMTHTASGAMQQLGNAVEDIEKSFGTLINKPVAEALNKVTQAVRVVGEWFEKLSPHTKDVIAAWAVGLGAAGALAAGLATLAGGLGVVMGFLPAVGAGVAALGAFAVSVVLPIIAIGGAFVLIHEAWASNLGGMQDKLETWVGGIKKFFTEAADTIKRTFGEAVEWISDKAIIAYGFVTGKSAEETGAVLRESHQEKGGLFSNPGAALAQSGTAIKGAIVSAGSDVAKVFGGMTDKLKGVLKSTFGLDVDKLLKGFAGTKHGHKALGGSGPGKIDFSFKDIMGTAAAMDGREKDQKAGNALAAGMKGAPEKVKEELGKLLNGIKTSTKMSDATLASLITTFSEGGKSGLKMRAALMRSATDMNAVPAVIAKGASNAAAYFASTDGKLAMLAANAQAAMGIAGDKILSGMGKAGSMIQNGMQGFASGGPLGAIAAVGTDLLMQSSSFQNLTANLNQMMGNLSQALNPLVDSLQPIMVALSGVFKSLGGALAGIFRSLQPIFGVIGTVVQMIGSILGPVIGVIGGVLQSIGQALAMPFKILLPIFKVLGTLLNAFAPALMAIQQALNPVNLVLELLKPVFELLHSAVQAFGKGVLRVGMFMANIWNTIVGFIAGVIESIASVLPDWLGGDALRSFGKSIRGAAINMDSMNKALESLNTTTLETEGQFGALTPPLQDATDNMNELSTSTTNVPTGFKVALARYNAIGSGGAAAVDPYFSTGQAGTGTGAIAGAVNDAAPRNDNSKNVNIEVLNVTGAGAQLTADKLEELLRQRNFIMTGSTSGSNNPNSTSSGSG